MKGSDVMELDRQLVRLKCQLVNRGYSTGTIKMYEQCWIHLRKIAQNMGIEEFNESLAKAFIDDRKKNQNFQKNEKKVSTLLRNDSIFSYEQ